MADPLEWELDLPPAEPSEEAQRELARLDPRSWGDLRSFLANPARGDAPSWWAWLDRVSSCGGTKVRGYLRDCFRHEADRILEAAPPGVSVLRGDDLRLACLFYADALRQDPSHPCIWDCLWRREELSWKAPLVRHVVFPLLSETLAEVFRSHGPSIFWPPHRRCREDGDETPLLTDALESAVVCAPRRDQAVLFDHAWEALALGAELPKCRNLALPTRLLMPSRRHAAPRVNAPALERLSLWSQGNFVFLREDGAVFEQVLGGYEYASWDVSELARMWDGPPDRVEVCAQRLNFREDFMLREALRSYGLEWRLKFGLPGWASGMLPPDVNPPVVSPP